MNEVQIFTQAVTLLITFATILSHYWVIKLKINELDYRMKTLETDKIIIAEIREKITKIEIMLQHLEEIVKKQQEQKPR